MGAKIHPKAIVESNNIGDNTRVWAFAHVMDNTEVGADCNIAEHCFIEAGAKVGNNVTIKNGISIWDKVTVEDDVFLGPHMIFTNDYKPRAFNKIPADKLMPTLIKKGATIGAGAIIVCGNSVGQYAFVAAGAVVTKDVPDHAVVQGNPGVIVGYMCKCTETTVKVDQTQRNCPKCGKF